MNNPLAYLSDDFILSQLKYYSRNLLAGPYHSRNLIDGLRLTYEQEARGRGLL